jgi:hypothetical protein
MQFFRYVALIFLSQGLSGCLSPLALDNMSLAYNEATANDISKQLLLNIARAQHNDPIHFSGISNFAATLDFQANIGATPALTGSNGSSLMPLFGVGAAENPTISIVPMQGAEFTKRLLTPMTENQLGLLLRQNVEVDLLLRLAVLEFRTRKNGREQVYFEPLIVEQHWSLPIKSMTPKGFQALEKEYTITLDQQQGVYRLDKRTVGRMIISNYDPSLLSADLTTRQN